MKIITLPSHSKIFLIYFILNTAPVISYACNEEYKLAQIGDLSFFLESLNRYDTAEYPSIYKAANQRVLFSICTSNNGETKNISIDVCKDETCTQLDENYKVKYITGWYKDSNYKKSVFHNKDRSTDLADELLLESSDFVINDDTTKKSKIKVKIDGQTDYIETDSFENIEPADKNKRIPHNASKYFISDITGKKTHSISGEQKFFVFGTTNKINTIYLSIKNPHNIDKISIPVINLPFSLEDTVNSGIYYRALYSLNKPTLSSERKTPEQLQMEFADMRSKGINYPTVFLYDDYQPYMFVRAMYDFPKDKIFLHDMVLYALIKEKKWDKIEERITKIKSDIHISQYKSIYFYIADEPNKEKYNEIVENIRPIFERKEVFPYVSGKSENLLDNIIDGGVYILAYNPDPKNAEILLKHNAKAYIYAIPQIGVYAPNKLRLNFGFKAMLNGYSGIMPYAYQDSFGSQWSDLDSIYRDHMLTYPVSDGLIDTIHGVSLENAITDMKYIATATKMNNEIKNLCNLSIAPPITTSDIGEDNLDESRLKVVMQLIESNKTFSECQK